MFDFLSKGKMGLRLDKMVFSQGETITGSISMQLKKPAKARGVFVVLFADQTKTRLTTKGIGRYTARVFEFKLPLDGEKEYGAQPYEYKFELKAPQQGQQVKMEGVAGALVDVATLFTVGQGSPPQWCVEAKLDIAGGFDLGKKTKINIG